ncbi:MAG: NAD(P)-dependent oxidoreductase [Alicyclobacillus herbarius]|uniref:NAD-dependent epimerase/dehydratase family protein n=1 Tax=Alicyclobacillus herbarius TaxID=122960 RepID=UPI0023522F90|nr:NAD(P)-dependent oxidoreductase [Alicyclobacillus herbarius]MCL6632088.1 NAD(P)-dependent oxidoreductase [Alicyclobacillus herbarius]
MRVVIIGGTGHIGTYLVPRLVEEGHEVINVSRRTRQPYQADGAWESVQHVQADRTGLEAQGRFGEYIAALKPDIVIDLICFTLASAEQLVEALRGQVQHFLHCGTIWVHGPSVRVPTTEDAPRRPFGDYGIQKAQIEKYLLTEARSGRLPATILHPGHIVGPGWEPLNPAGHFNPEVFARLASGAELALPNFGLETVHHVHADDVAQAFQQAIRHWSTSIGESFHVVSPAAITLRGYAEAVARWFGREANLRFLPWEAWRQTVSQKEAEATWDHIAHSPNCSIAKAESLLGYKPRYESLQAVREAVDWLLEHGKIQIEESSRL